MINSHGKTKQQILKYKDNNNMDPFGIILLVSERSGSNLLRTLIGNHSDISAPIAPHLLHVFYNIKQLYK